MKFLVFLGILFSIKVVLLEWAYIWVGLMITFTVRVSKDMRTWFTLFCFQPKRISLFIHFTIQHKVTVVFGFVRTIIFYALWSLNFIYKVGMFLFPTILIPWNFWIHICFSNCGNVASNIEAPIDETLSLRPTLDILYNNHVKF